MVPSHLLWDTCQEGDQCMARFQPHVLGHLKGMYPAVGITLDGSIAFEFPHLKKKNKKVLSPLKKN